MKNFTSADEADPVEGSLYRLGPHSSIQPHWQILPRSPHTQLSLDRFDSTAEFIGSRIRWPAVACSTTAVAHNKSAAGAADSDIAPVRTTKQRPPCRGRGTTAAARVIDCAVVSYSNYAADGTAGSGAIAR